MKHVVSPLKKSIESILFKKLIAVYCVCKKKLIVQNTEIFSVKSGGIYNYHWILTHWGRGQLNCLNAVSGVFNNFNPLNAELNPICYLLALLAHHFLHVSRIRVNQLIYCVSLKIYNKFANYFCELKFSGNTHQRP